VYSYNDFSHTGDNPGVKPKKTVTPDMNKALIVSEHNGHMFPTKSYDTWQRRQEHALRHARVQNDAAADGEHAGCFGWCMFDYQTHKDFGSGDRICYHGVMDAFRNPKTAAAVYASQGDARPVLELGSTMDIGDYPAGQPGAIYAFTNADEVRLYKNGDYVASFAAKGWSGLPHGPVLIDDTIGELLESKEGFTGAKERMLHKCLVSAGKYGLANMPLADKLRMLACMLRYKLSFDDGVALYGKYVGNWRGDAVALRGLEGRREDLRAHLHSGQAAASGGHAKRPAPDRTAELGRGGGAHKNCRRAGEHGKLRPAPRDAESQRGRGACRPRGRHRRGRHVRHIRKDHREERPRAARDIRAADGVCDA